MNLNILASKTSLKMANYKLYKKKRIQPGYANILLLYAGKFELIGIKLLLKILTLVWK